MKRDLEGQTKCLEALRAHLDEGAKQAKQGEFAEFSVGDTVAGAMKRARK